MLRGIKAFFRDLWTRLKERKSSFRNPLAEGQIRNEICLCGSRKKIKACCGSRREISYKEFQRITRMIQRAGEIMDQAEKAARAKH